VKTPIRITGLFLSVSFIFSTAHGQGAFQNLGFELAPTDLGPGSGSDYYSIPYWNATCGPYQTGVTLNSFVLDATTVSLHTGQSFTPIDGTFSLLLTSSSFSYPSSPIASISQTGLVPGTAQSLHFLVADVMTFQLPTTLPGQFFVTMNGENVALQAVANNGSYTELAGNVSDWAGQTAALTIGMSVPASHFQVQEVYFQGLIDDISFSSTSVPEPTTTVLGVMAGGSWLLCMRIRRRHRSSSVSVRG
jgi:hypothetical protein